MAFRTEGPRRISLAIPDTSTMNLLGSERSIRNSYQGRRPQPWQVRTILGNCFPYLVGPILLLVFLGVSYLVFDIKVHVSFHRPFGLSQSPAVCSPNQDNFTVVDVNDEAVFVDDVWHGYQHYLKRLERLRVLPLQKSHELQVAGRGPYGFAHFSSYRMKANVFAVVGFGARALAESAAWSRKRCWWEDNNNSTIEGVVRVLYSEEDKEFTYDTIIFQCWLNNATGVTGGVAFATIDGEDIILYREKRNKEHLLDPPSDKFLQHYVTVCAPSLRDQVEPRTMLENIEYHRHVGADHFILYDAGAFDEPLAQAMEGFLQAGVVEVVPFREVKRFEMPKEGYNLAMHDCIYRSRFTSKWVLYIDWDDYLYVPQPQSLSSLLTKYDDKPWLTHGTLVWSVDMCRPGPPVFGGERWAFSGSRLPFVIERMAFHWPLIVCHGAQPGDDPKTCVNHAGERKYICNPRRVETVHLHEVAMSDEGGLHLNFDEIHHHTYKYLHLKNNFSKRACATVIRDDQHVDWWTRDMSQVEYTKELRNSPIPIPN